jgi:hypothetical protein
MPRAMFLVVVQYSSFFSFPNCDLIYKVIKCALRLRTMKGYFKEVSSFTLTSPEMSAIQDFATLHVNYIAQYCCYVQHEL